MAATIVQYLGTGRRKRSVARVFLRPGKGEIKVNNRAFENYFPTESSRAMVRQPLAATETMDKFDLLILADGGGVAGQAGAARLGISRALVEFNAELRSRLKKLGFLTRDPARPRAKEVRPEGRSQAVPVLQTLESPRSRKGAVLLFRPSGFAVFYSLDRVVRSIFGSLSFPATAQISLWAAQRRGNPEEGLFGSGSFGSHNLTRR